MQIRAVEDVWRTGRGSCGKGAFSGFSTQIRQARTAFERASISSIFVNSINALILAIRLTVCLPQF
jgi:hypothetical protein